VRVQKTCIDRFEAHLLEQQPDGSLTPYPAHERPGKGHYVAASSSGKKPQAFISQVEAAAACEHAGKRLCGLTEWYRACTGAPRTTYPYGQSYEAGRCNVGKKHLLSMLHGASASGWSYADFNDPALGQADGFLALTGEYAGCTSAEGVNDLVGNLHEWVADRVDETLPSKLPLPAIIERRIGRHVGNGIFMGGFFSTMNQHGEGCNFTTAAHDPRYHDYSTGFRCCADAGP
jgi:formylglycine-generating enzyme